MIIINAKRNGYAPEQCGRTLTAGELIGILEQFDESEPVYLSHDGGYTYGSIIEDDFDELEEEDEE